MIDLGLISGFEWDEGNSRMNEKHGVSTAEAEQVFFNTPLFFFEDVLHSPDEPRIHILGKTDDERTLHITVAMRQSNALIRVISARPMNRNEKVIYEQGN